MSRKKKPDPVVVQPARYVWHVTPFEWPEYNPNVKRCRRVKVGLYCNNELVQEGHGRVFWLTYQELAQQYTDKNIPRRPMPGKVLADYGTPDARSEAACGLHSSQLRND